MPDSLQLFCHHVYPSAFHLISESQDVVESIKGSLYGGDIISHKQSQVVLDNLYLHVGVIQQTLVTIVRHIGEEVGDLYADFHEVVLKHFS